MRFALAVFEIIIQQCYIKCSVCWASASLMLKRSFGAMLGAFKYGAPPHAGCAFGVDRILMELTDEQNVRETLAFPKNGSGVDVMMDSPSTVDPAQLRELGL